MAQRPEPARAAGVALVRHGCPAEQIVVFQRSFLIGADPFHADNCSCCFSSFKVRNSVLRLIPKMVVNSLTGSPCWYNRRSRFCCAASSFNGFVAARPRAIRASRGCGAALLAQFEFQLGDGGRDAGDGAPGRSAGVHAFPQGPHVDATAVSSWRAVATSRTERPSLSTATTTRTS